MRSIVTLAGVDEAIDNLGYTNERHIKTRIIRSIRQFYSDENSTRTVTAINTDDLIRLLWDTDTGSDAVKNRRKNFSSIKSSINADLAKLHDEGKNPEGITIGRNNTFDMSDKAKSELLENFSGSGDGDSLIPLGKINDVLGIINDLLRKDQTGTGTDSQDNRNSFKQLKDLIQSISQSIGISDVLEDVEDIEDAEEIDEAEDLEEVDELPPEEELIDDIEVVEEDEELDEAEVEEVPEDEIEEVEELEVAEVPEDEIEKVEDLEDAEEIDEAEDMEEVDELPPEEELLDDIEVVQEDEALDEAEVEEVPEDEIEEVDDLEDAEEIDEAEDMEEVDELPPEEELEEVEDIQDAEEIDEAEDLEEVDELPPEEELVDDIEVVEGDEALDEAEVEEVPEDELEEVDDLEDAEEIDEAEDMEEVDELPPEDEIVDDIEVVEGDEALDEAEVEEVPEDELEEVEDLEDAEEIDEAEDMEEVDELPPEEELEEVEDIQDAEEIDEAEDLEEVDDELEEIDELEDAEIEQINNERFLSDEFNNMLSEMDRYYNQYILIPKGRYPVGSKDPKGNHRAADTIDIKSFSFGKFPVTNALFEIFIEKTGYVTTAERIGHGTVFYGRYQNIVDNKTGLKTLNWNSAVETRVIEGACWYQPTGPGNTLHGKRNHPVVQVSIEDAKAFAGWTGKRIPTEAQWEAASRTLKGHRYPWTKGYRKGCCNIEDSYIGDTTPVDQYSEGQNSLGIMDILGNVMEWTIDTYQSSANSMNALYIVKGGSWISGDDISLDDRSFSEPDSVSNILGFRCIAY